MNCKQEEEVERSITEQRTVTEIFDDHFETDENNFNNCNICDFSLNWLVKLSFYVCHVAQQWMQIQTETK